MAKRTPIFLTYVFARILDDGSLEYFKSSNGYLIIHGTRNGVPYTVKSAYPTESQMNKEGWYRVVNIAENPEGENTLVDNIIYHKTGLVDNSDDPVEEEED